MSQSDLAMVLGVHLSLVSSWERGRVRLPDYAAKWIRTSGIESRHLTEFGSVFRSLMSGANRERTKGLGRSRKAAKVEGSVAEKAAALGVHPHTIERYAKKYLDA